MPDIGLASALAALAGALTVYFLRFSDQRNKNRGAFFRVPWRQWRTISFDAVAFIAAGVAVVAYVIEPASTKEAFLGGAAWPAFVSYIVPTRE